MSHDPNRKVQVINPITLGEQLKRFKTRPNNPCLCGSGRKQKKCCGDGSKYMSTNRKARVPNSGFKIQKEQDPSPLPPSDHE